MNFIWWSLISCLCHQIFYRDQRKTLLFFLFMRGVGDLFMRRGVGDLLGTLLYKISQNWINFPFETFISRIFQNLHGRNIQKHIRCHIKTSITSYKVKILNSLFDKKTQVCPKRTGFTEVTNRTKSTTDCKKVNKIVYLESLLHVWLTNCT